MTKFQKQMLTIAAAGALTAVTALPAMAFEHNFNGTFVAKTYLSNIDGVGFLRGNVDTKTNNFTDQRTRINYTAKASDDLKLVTQFEMQTYWGDGGSGGDIDTDGNNLVVRYAHLDFNLGKDLNMKVGQQQFKDTFGGLYADADLPMARLAYKAGNYTLGLGYSRFADENNLTIAGDSYKGDKASDLYVLENTYAINKDTKVGLSYYLNRSDSGVAPAYDKKINTLGLFGQTKMAGIDLSGFVAMQKGYRHTAAADVNYHGWATNMLAKMKLGNGLVRTGFLFTSGDNSDKQTSNHAWQTINASAGNPATILVSENAVQNSYNESGMMLLVRNTSMGGTSNDYYLRKPITNIALLHAGYNANINEKLYANGNIGFAWLPSSSDLYGHTGAEDMTAAQLTAANLSGRENGGDYLGTELNVEVGYKLYKNLTLKAQAAYVALGSAYSGTALDDNGSVHKPANPWTLRAGAFYSF